MFDFCFRLFFFSISLSVSYARWIFLVVRFARFVLCKSSPLVSLSLPRRQVRAEMECPTIVRQTFLLWITEQKRLNFCFSIKNDFLLSMKFIIIHFVFFQNQKEVMFLLALMIFQEAKLKIASNIPLFIHLLLTVLVNVVRFLLFSFPLDFCFWICFCTISILSLFLHTWTHSKFVFCS